jgi:hypothetical protein
LLDSFAVCVDQFDLWKIESLKVLVREARAAIKRRQYQINVGSARPRTACNTGCLFGIEHQESD